MTAADVRNGRRVWQASGAVTALVGLLGSGIGVVALVRGFGPAEGSGPIPLMRLAVRGDALGGAFVLVTGVVAVAAGVYAIGYGKQVHLPRTAAVCLPVFVVAMSLVPLASSVTTFLLMWELMAVVSLVLVLAEHHRDAARSAGLSYAVLTQLGFAFIVIALVLLSARTGSSSFAGMQARAGGLSPATRDAVFLLTLAGFGSKAGLVPLHAWLPRAHPEAPSPVSALMSAAMVNLGVYGLLRFDAQVLGPGPRWWGMTVIGVGCASAVYGVLQATVVSDLKRMLGFSTTEHMGLVAIAIGLALVLRASGNPQIAQVAAAAAVLHVLNHAAFKALAFLAAGAVVATTGERDLDRLGGLAHRMPATTSWFGVAALGAAGLPLGCGFISEWLIVQSLLHGLPRSGLAGSGVLLGVTIPAVLGVVALTVGLGVAAMVKAFGVGFLARPRSAGARAAREVSASMSSAMAALAVVCTVLAFVPAVGGAVVRRAVSVVFGVGTGTGVVFADQVRLPGRAAVTSPALLALGCVVGALLVWAGVQATSRRRPARRDRPLWMCGGAAPSAAMQYTATSFAQPLQRVFSDVVRAEVELDVTHVPESAYVIRAITYRAQVADVIEARVYAPVVRAVVRVAGWVRAAHTGSIHAYLAFGALGVLIAVLVVS